MQRFVLHNNWMSRTAQVWVSTLFYVLHIIRFYTIFCRASSCSASYHFSHQLPRLLGNETPHTLEEMGENAEHIALVTQAFI